MSHCKIKTHPKPFAGKWEMFESLEESINSSPEQSKNSSIHWIRQRRKLKRKRQTKGSIAQSNLSALDELYEEDTILPKEIYLNPFEDEILLAAADRENTRQSQLPAPRFCNELVTKEFLTLRSLPNISAEICPSKVLRPAESTTQLSSSESRFSKPYEHSQIPEEILQDFLNEVSPDSFKSNSCNVKKKTIADDILADFCGSPDAETRNSQLLEDSSPVFQFRNKPIRTYTARTRKYRMNIEKQFQVTVDNYSDGSMSDCSSELSVQEDLKQNVDYIDTVDLNNSVHINDNLQSLSAYFSQYSEKCSQSSSKTENMKSQYLTCFTTPISSSFVENSKCEKDFLSPKCKSDTNGTKISHIDEEEEFYGFPDSKNFDSIEKKDEFADHALPDKSSSTQSDTNGTNISQLDEEEEFYGFQDSKNFDSIENKEEFADHALPDKSSLTQSKDLIPERNLVSTTNCDKKNAVENPVVNDCDYDWSNDSDIFLDIKTQSMLIPQVEPTIIKDESITDISIGFMTASQKPIPISKNALAKAAHIFAEETLKESKQTNDSLSKCKSISEIHIEENSQEIKTEVRDQQFSKCFVQRETAIVEKTSTQSNFDQNISAKKQLNPVADVDQKENLIGFQTASNKRIQVSNKSMSIAQKILQSLPEIPTNSKECNPQSSTTKCGKISSSDKEDAKQIEEEVQSSILNGVESDTNVNNRAIGMSTTKQIVSSPDNVTQSNNLQKHNSNSNLEKKTDNAVGLDSTAKISEQSPQNTSLCFQISVNQFENLNGKLKLNESVLTQQTTITPRRNLLSLSKRKSFKPLHKVLSAEKKVQEMGTPTRHVEPIPNSARIHTPSPKTFIGSIANTSTPNTGRETKLPPISSDFNTNRAKDEIDQDFSKIHWDDSNTSLASMNETNLSCENASVANIKELSKPPPISPLVLGGNGCRPSGLRRSMRNRVK